MQRVHSGSFYVEQGFRCLLLVFYVNVGCVLAQEKVYYGGGTGEPNDPYQIWTPEQFVAINAHSEDWGSSFRLMADVNLAAMDPELIAPIGNHAVPFSGVFDGNDFAIENYVLHSDTLNDVGIFGLVSTQVMQDRIDPYGLGKHYTLDYETYEFDADEAVVHVQDLTIVNAEVRGKKNVAVVAARCYGSIRGCCVTQATVVNTGSESEYMRQSNTQDGVLVYSRLMGSTISSSSAVGHLFVGNLIDCHVSSVMVDGVGMVAGLVGFSHGSNVTLCSVQGSFSGDFRTGGVVGHAASTRVEQCCAEVSISGEGDTGGLLGSAASARIEQCRAEVNVSAGKVDISHGQNIGGLIGSSSGTTLSECCALGQVKGGPLSQYMGGFIGSSSSTHIDNCYSSCDMNGPSLLALGGFVGRSSGDALKSCYSSGHVYFVPDPNLSIPEWVQLGPRASFIGERRFVVRLGQAAEACFWDMDASGSDVGVNYRMSYTDIDLPHEDIFWATTEEMWTQQTYADVGWDFETVWAIEEGLGYPFLQWELTGDSRGQ